MYKYFSVNEEILGLDMIAVTTFVISKTAASLAVLKDVVKCALIKDCMAPMDSVAVCDSEIFSQRKYANCHKYDQSALALSLARCSSDVDDYQGITDIIAVQRLAFGEKKGWRDIKNSLSLMKKERI